MTNTFHKRLNQENQNKTINLYINIILIVLDKIVQLFIVNNSNMSILFYNLLLFQLLFLLFPKLFVVNF